MEAMDELQRMIWHNAIEACAQVACPEMLRAPFYSARPSVV